MTILDKIVEQTAEDLSKRKRKVSFHDFDSFEGFEKPRVDFAGALVKKDQVSVIAEVKKASPSKGVIREDFDPVDIALRYEEGGASAISVLTDEPFFRGKLEYLDSISRRVQIPVLRKDFIIDPYQIKEARAFGADAVLVIVAITEGSQLDELLYAAKEFGLEVLVECYDQQDFDRLNFDLVNILGVNNRDLRTFEVDVHRGIDILKQAPKSTILVSESGLSTPKDLVLLRKKEIHAVLMGEYFMRQKNPGKAVSELLEKSEEEFLNRMKMSDQRSRPKIKICGITNLEDARFISGALVDYLGFIFYEKSPRFIEPAQAGAIINWLEGPEKVGVFVNQPLDEVNQIARQTGIDYVQLHGNETPEYCSLIEKPVIKAIHIEKEMPEYLLKHQIEQFSVVADYLLFDTKTDELWGGTGQSFDWNILNDVIPEKPFFLSGGLNASNIQKAIEAVNPTAVDISSSLESEPGIKDYDKVEELMEIMNEIVSERG